MRQALQRLATDGTLVSIKNGVGDHGHRPRPGRDRPGLLSALRAGGDDRPHVNPHRWLTADLGELADPSRPQVKALLATGAARRSPTEFSELANASITVNNTIRFAHVSRDFIEILYHQTDRFWFGWMSQADIRIEGHHFLHEVEETLRALEINDFEAKVGYIRRNHITMMLAADMAAFRDPIKA